jgi:hypothetical protein
MNKIPTAEDLIFKMDKIFFMDSPDTQGTAIDIDSVKELMIEFAKLHVEQCKVIIKKELEEGLDTFGISLTDDFKLEETGNSLINNSYPLENIK